jgi:hypothetical protein
MMKMMMIMTHLWRNNNYAVAHSGMSRSTKPVSGKTHRVALGTAFIRHLYEKSDTLFFRLQRVIIIDRGGANRRVESIYVQDDHMIVSVGPERRLQESVCH